MSIIFCGDIRLVLSIMYEFKIVNMTHIVNKIYYGSLLVSNLVSMD